MKEGWGYKKLNELCEVITKGTTPTTLGYTFSEVGINFIKIESISTNRKLLRDKLNHISEECNKSMSRSQLQESDLLFSIAGALGRIYIVEKSVLPANTNQALAIIRLKNKQDLFLRYLSYYLSSNTLKRQIDKDKVGVAQLNLSLSQIKNFVTPIPSVKVQQHIVEESDLLSSIIEKKKAQLNELDNLAQSLFCEMFGDPITNDKGWEVKQIGDICNPVKNIKWNAFSEEDTFTYIDLSAVDRSDRCIKDTIFICKNDAPSRAKQIVKTGDVLFGTTRPTLKRVCTINKEFDGSICSTGFCVIRPKQEIIKSHIVYYNLLTNSFYAYIEPLQSGASYPAVTDKIVKSFTIPIPPIELQQEFASKIEFIERQKEVINKSINEVETLFNSRMDYYFN